MRGDDGFDILGQLDHNLIHLIQHLLVVLFNDDFQVWDIFDDMVSLPIAFASLIRLEPDNLDITGGQGLDKDILGRI